jgi:hypothetical protein
LLVAKHYYGAAWRTGDCEPGSPDAPNRFDKRFSRAKSDSQLLDAQSFTFVERTQLFIA